MYMYTHVQFYYTVHYSMHCMGMFIVSLLAENDAIAASLRALNIKTQTIKEVQEAKSNPIKVLAGRHLSTAYQEMGKVLFN